MSDQFRIWLILESLRSQVAHFKEEAEYPAKSLSIDWLPVLLAAMNLKT